MRRPFVVAASLVFATTLMGSVAADAGPIASAGGGIPIAVDEAVTAGLAQSSVTMNAVIADVNGDRLPDILLGHHGTAPAQLFENDGVGGFTEVDAGTFVKSDRHDCAAADVDGDGHIDVTCGTGADHGVGVKRNQLWIQGPGMTFTDQGVARGVGDPFGRGRQPLFFDANGDGLPDLFITNDPARPDGIPSPDRLFLNRGGGVFRDTPSAGLDVTVAPRSLGTGCVQAADVNGDGLLDVLICGTDHLHVFVNQGDAMFVDEAELLGVASDSPNDALLVDLNSDGVLDLAEVTTTNVIVRIQTGGVFDPPAYGRHLSSGAAIAAGDVDGRGGPDLYVVQAGDGTTNEPDLMLLNTTAGGVLGFSPMVIPQVTTGEGQSAFPLDYDHNGLVDFLVLNGQDIAGPVELIAFFPPGAAPRIPRSGEAPIAAQAIAPPASQVDPAAGAAATTACTAAFTPVSFPAQGANLARLRSLSGVASDGWAVGTMAGNLPLAEHWNGTAWSESETPRLHGVAGLNAVLRLGPNDAWSVGYLTENVFGTVAERWDGSAWSVVPTIDPGPDGNVLVDLGVASGSDLWAVGYTTAGQITQPLIEHWDGTVWSLSTPEVGSWDQAALTAVLVTSPTDAWAVGWSESGGMYQGLVEHWDGSAWSVAQTPSVPRADSSLFLAISTDRAGGTWVVGYRALGSHYDGLIEHWDGTVWTIVPSVNPGPTVTVMRGVNALSPNDAWAVGMNQASDGDFHSLLEHWDGTTWSIFASTGLSVSDPPAGAVSSFSGSDVWVAAEGSHMEHLCPFVVTDDGPTPGTAAAPQGQSVLWQVPATDTQSHSVTDATGLGLFDSGLLAPGSTYTTVFEAAGRYLVQDTVTGATAQVEVALVASPSNGPVGTVFTITWAVADAPAGDTYQIQIQLPGSITWSNWLRTTTPSASYEPTDPGTYRFRARMIDLAAGTSSDYSPKVAIVVS